jgi:excinuclease ABC subunit C
MVTTLLDMVRQIYKLRTCNLNLTREKIEKKKFKVCLEYHIGNCKGPCEALQTPEDYMQTIGYIKDILKGNVNSVIRHLEEMMNRYAENVEYEKAQEIKEKIEILERYKGKSVIVSQTITNADVFSIVADEIMSYVNFLKVINGFIIQTHTIEMKKKLDESPSELLALAIGELRSRFQSDAAEIIVPFPPDLEIPGVVFTIPKIGDKKHLLDLSMKNVRYYMREREEQLARVNPGQRIERLMNRMMKDLRMNEPPVHIECFDNSNFRGKFAVAAMSVFKNGKPSKKDYRHFTIKTVEGIDDFASMEEIIFRRYKRVLEEKQPLPQLIVIDGGKGQLSAALKSLGKLGLKGKVTVIGIAKKLEEIYYPGDSVPMYLDKKSETLKIIQQLRDEVHRFGITHHRNKRSKSFAVSELENIKGIGEATVHSLLSHFRSVKRIKESSENELAEIIGSAKAKAVKEYFTSLAS